MTWSIFSSLMLQVSQHTDGIQSQFSFLIWGALEEECSQFPNNEAESL